MKYIFLIIIIMANNDIYSQEQNYLKTIRIELRNSVGENIGNARIVIDSAEIKYDTLTKTYFGHGEFSQNFTLKITCKGYEDLTYKRTDIPYSINSTDFVARLYLIGQGDKYYYRHSKLKVSYIPRPSNLLVALKQDVNRSAKEIIDSFEKNIKRSDLIIYRDFVKDLIINNSVKKMNIDDPLSGSELQVIVKKKDGTNFDSDFCNELEFLRQLEEVDFAGPLIISSDNYPHTLTYDNTINMKLSNASITNSELDKEKAMINSIIKQIHQNSFLDEDNLIIVLPPSSNEIIPEVINQLNESIENYEFYSIVKTKLLRTKCNLIQNMHVNKTAELADQNSQFKTANMDYYTRGNQKIAFQKKTNFIGVAFKNEMSKASVLKLIEDWELTVDAVYMNGLFFVLKFPVNLSSDIIKTIRESIILSKEVTTVGDILTQTENNLILATQDLIVKWKSETSEAVKQTFIKQHGLMEIRKISYITGGFQYRIEPNIAYASTDICLKLLETGIVEFAEPVIISTSEDD